MTKLKVVVVGGGIFGVTTAVELARAGHQVTLYEANSDILTSASGINQYRLHRGYHYPRSRETGRASVEAEASFRARYGPAVVDFREHYYAIAAEGSLTSDTEYLAFCDEMGLEYEHRWPEFVHSDKLSLSIRARESLIDPDALRSVCWSDLQSSGVEVKLQTTVSADSLRPYDFAVIATYARINEIASEIVGRDHRYQFEVVEKPVVRLPREYSGKSVVIMDGPFMCIDPLGSTELFVMGNVVQAIHSTTIGSAPDVPDQIRPLLNSGIIENPPITRFEHFIESASEFFEGMEQAEHVGSMFTIRTVLAGVEASDARPTIVQKVNESTVTIYSGKIGTCVRAATDVRSILEPGASFVEGPTGTSGTSAIQRP